MFSSSYSANYWSSKRGEIHKLLPQTHSSRLDYSLFIMETVEKSLDKMETTPAAPRWSFPPPICNSMSLFLGFYVSAALPSERRRETIFIVVFRSRWRHGDEDRRHRSHEEEKRVLHAAKESGRVGPPISFLGLPLLTILGSYVSFLAKNDPREILGHLDVVWVTETSKYRK